jgi:hypothetical protein
MKYTEILATESQITHAFDDHIFNMKDAITAVGYSTIRILACHQRGVMNLNIKRFNHYKN